MWIREALTNSANPAPARRRMEAPNFVCPRRWVHSVFSPHALVARARGKTALINASLADKIVISPFGMRASCYNGSVSPACLPDGRVPAGFEVDCETSGAGKMAKAEKGRHAAQGADAERGARPDSAVLPVDAHSNAGAHARGGKTVANGGFVMPKGGAGAARSRTPLKVFGIVLAVIVGVLAVIYVAGAIVFMGRFLPNTVIRGQDVSLKTPEEVHRVFQESMAGYQLRIEGDGFSLALSPEDVGLDLDGVSLAQALLDEANPWMWPYEALQHHDETAALAATYSESGVSDAVTKAVDDFNASATFPEDAFVSFDKATGRFVVSPEKRGTALSAEAVTQLATRSLAALETKAALTEDQLAAPSVLSTDERLVQAADTANEMAAVNVTFTMAGTPAVTLDANVVSQWISFADDLSVSLDDSLLVTWVDEVAKTYTTTGIERTYTRPDGKKVKVSGGTYGWKIDRDALLEQAKSAVESGQTGEVDMPCIHTAGSFSAVGLQDWGARYVDVDLGEQYARMYDESSQLIWETPIVSGKPNANGKGSITPSGVYYLNAKQSPSVLKGKNDDGTEYESHVEYWMPFVGNAIGLHDASWQSSFGGTRYRDGAGSHGCVNLPVQKAAEIYGLLKLSDVIVVHW